MMFSSFLENFPQLQQRHIRLKYVNMPAAEVVNR